MSLLAKRKGMYYEYNKQFVISEEVQEIMTLTIPEQHWDGVECSNDMCIYGNE